MDIRGPRCRIIGARAGKIAMSCGLAFGIATGSVAGQDAPKPPASRAAISMSFAPIVEKTSPAVVNIFARKIVQSQSPIRALDGSAFWRLFRDTLLFGYGRERIVNSLGSGVIVAPNGIIVTNHHVIQSAQGILVSLADGSTFPGFIILSDKRTDIAILRILTGGPALPHIEFGDSDKLKVGDLVVAIGNPFGIGQTVTSGIVSALARTTVGITDFRFFVQTDAAINPGNSGGALLSMDGKLVGINTAIHSRSGGSQGLGFAVPSNMVRTVVESAMRGRPLLRPWIGVSGRRVPPRLAALIGLQGRGAVIITTVFPDGPAARAGLEIGDIVLSINGNPVTDFQSMRYRIATQLVGDHIDLRILRRGAETDVRVALASPPDLPARNDTWLPSLSPFSGARVASLSPALAEEFGLDSAISGIVVLNVRGGSAAARVGLREGDIIRAFDDRELRTVEELLEVRLPQFKPWRMRVTRSGNDISISGG